MNLQKRKNFKRLMSPKNIAFFGGRDVEVAITEAKRRGFLGEIWPVNPKRKSILGIDCFSSVKDLPEAPDASFIAVPAKFVSTLIEELSSIGAGGVVCYSAGFSETGPKGMALEEQIKILAKDMPIIGPNCYGFINYLDNVALWPFAHGGSSPGYGAAIITQSGMLSSDITMTERSIPLTHMISIGNQSSVSIEDLIEILADTPQVKAIGVHIEGIKNINKLHDVALKALAKNVPIVALKTGTSVIGESLTTTHTGSLSGEDKLYDALFERIGIIRVKNPIQFIEVLKFLCVSGIPSDNSLVAFTCSGGGATMIADYAEKIGINIPNFDKNGTKKLENLLPDIATVSNPLDYTTPIWGDEARTEPVFRTAIKESKASVALLLQDYPAKGLDESEHYYLNDAKAFIKAVKAINIPAAICSTFPENMRRKIRDGFVEEKISPMQGIEETLDAIKLISNLKRRQKELKKHIVKPLLISGNSGTSKFLDETMSKELLLSMGIQIPKGQHITASNIGKTSIKVNFPVALKLISASIIHKTDYGAIAINIKSRVELLKKVKEMGSHLKKSLHNEFNDQFLIEEMKAPPIIEMLIGIQADQQFGYSLLLGSGGTQAEVIDDTISILLPTNKVEIITAIKKLKLFKLMDGFRGREKVNLSKLATYISNITYFFEENAPNYSSLEVNPLFVYKDTCCAIDAVIALGPNSTI